MKKNLLKVIGIFAIFVLLIVLGNFIYKYNFFKNISYSFLEFENNNIYSYDYIDKENNEFKIIKYNNVFNSQVLENGEKKIERIYNITDGKLYNISYVSNNYTISENVSEIDKEDLIGMPNLPIIVELGKDMISKKSTLLENIKYVLNIKSIKKDILNIQKCFVVEYKFDKSTMQVWFDEETLLPVQEKVNSELNTYKLTNKNIKSSDVELPDLNTLKLYIENDM